MILLLIFYQKVAFLCQFPNPTSQFRKRKKKKKKICYLLQVLHFFKFIIKKVRPRVKK